MPATARRDLPNFKDQIQAHDLCIHTNQSEGLRQSKVEQKKIEEIRTCKNDNLHHKDQVRGRGTAATVQQNALNYKDQVQDRNVTSIAEHDALNYKDQLQDRHVSTKIGVRMFRRRNFFDLGSPPTNEHEQALNAPTTVDNSTPVLSAVLVDENAAAREAQERKRLASENVRYMKIIWVVIAVGILVMVIVLATVLSRGNGSNENAGILSTDASQANNAKYATLNPTSTVLTYDPTIAATAPTTQQILPLQQTQLFTAVDSYWGARLDGREPAATLQYGYTLNDWDVSNIQDFSSVFDAYRNPSMRDFREYIGDWNVSNAQNMSMMFQNASSFTGDGIGNWDVSQVADMSLMFQNALSLNADLSTWNTRNVRTMHKMFRGATYFRGKGVASWNVSQVTDIAGMFDTLPFFDSDLRDWDVSHVEDMSGMFQDGFSFHGLGLENWTVDRVTNMNHMFYQCSAFDNVLLDTWNVSSVTNMNTMFYECKSFTGTGLESWDTGQVTDMSFMFRGAKVLDIDFSNWDVSKVTTTQTMFGYTDSFAGTGLENWNIENVTDATYMFLNAVAFDANLSTWNMSKVHSMYGMFQGAESFQGIGLDSWDVSNVEDIRYALCKTRSIINQSIVSGWNTDVDVFQCLL